MNKIKKINVRKWFEKQAKFQKIVAIKSMNQSECNSRKRNKRFEIILHEIKVRRKAKIKSSTFGGCEIGEIIRNIYKHDIWIY